MNDRIKIADAEFLAGIDAKAESLKGRNSRRGYNRQTGRRRQSLLCFKQRLVIRRRYDLRNSLADPDQVNSAGLKPGDVVY